MRDNLIAIFIILIVCPGCSISSNKGYVVKKIDNDANAKYYIIPPENTCDGKKGKFVIYIPGISNDCYKDRSLLVNGKPVSYQRNSSNKENHIIVTIPEDCPKYSTNANSYTVTRGSCTDQDKKLVESGIKKALPKSYQESLSFWYGLDVQGKHRWVNINPGMTIRVETSTFFDEPGIQSYISGPIKYYSVIRKYKNGIPITTFDPFLSRMSSTYINETLATGSANDRTAPSNWAASAIDLQNYPTLKSHWMIYYPSQYSKIKPSYKQLNAKSSNEINPELPNISYSKNTILIGANSTEDLDKFRNSISTSNSIYDECQDKKNTYTCLVFRERGVVTPMISISINGNDELIEVGTTLQDIINKHVDMIDAEILGLSANIARHANIRRWYGAEKAPLHFEIDMQDEEALALPLLKGDEVTLW